MFASTLRPKQIEFVEAFRKNSRITFRGGVGFGKTHAVAVLVLWAIICFDKIQVSVFGPTEGQLNSGLWKELKLLFHKLPPEFRDRLELNETKLSRKECVSAFAEKKIANKDNPEAARGTHMPRNWVIVDEASGVDDRVFDVLDNIFTDEDPKLCLISNPTKTSGFFFRTHEDPDIAVDWVQVHGQATDNPGLTPDRLAAMVRAKGGPLARKTRIDVFGEFPLSDDESLISLDSVLTAVHAEDVVPASSVLPVWGLDPAGPGRDRSVLVKRHDNTVTDVLEWRGLDTIQLAHRVKAEFDKLRPHERPAVVAVDAIGLGQGVYDNLAALGLPARRVIVSNKPVKSPDGFHRLRDELWFLAKEWLEAGGVKLPDNADLIKELCLPNFDYQNGKVKVEDKKSIRKRGRASPDVADALCLTFAAPVQRRQQTGFNRVLQRKRVFLA